MTKRPIPTKKECKAEFEGSDELFEACWRKIGKFIREGDIENPHIALEAQASEFVNDSSSRFFVRG